MKQSAGPASNTAEDSPSSKKQKTDTTSDSDLRRFYRSWAWKREHRPDRDRFHRPYQHTLLLPPTLDQSNGSSPTDPTGITLSIKQKKFGAEGFASTVWDSSIVMAKFIEKWQQKFTGRRCLDLSAGCGLVAVVMSRLGAQVTATDLEPNLPLLRDNCTLNGASDVVVFEHRWGHQLGDLQPPYDVITACDVMYISELVPDLMSSLLALTGPESLIYIAHGRNRPAEAAFRAAAQQHFAISMVPDDDLDEVYQCSDVEVLQLRPLKGTQESSAMNQVQPPQQQPQQQSV